VRALTAGMRLARKIGNQPTLSGYVAGELVPGTDANSDADFEAAVRRNGISNLRPVGTCRSGGDEAAVLDPRLHVRGIERLRVAAASIMSSVPAGNTNAPSIMIGEKASDMTLEDARVSV
jgi:choline dehydrogenase